VWHWADGGPTDLENLVLLCRTHHRAVHEAGGDCNANPTAG
jgi:HNH endonuclease